MMHMNRRSALYLIGLCFLYISTISANSQTIFRKVAPPIGSFGVVGGIAQDKEGYMWFATGRGLYRYDGYRFKLFTHNPSDPNSIGETHLETVYADSRGFIWIATWTSGLDRLDPASNNIIHFRHHADDPASLSHDFVRSIVEDHQGVIWIATHGGLDRYDSTTGKFQHYRNNPGDPQSLSCNIVRILYVDKQGTLWVGTGSPYPGEGAENDEGGLNRLDRRTGKFIRFLHDPNNPNSLINNKIGALYEDSKGVFWVGTAGDGLHTMNLSNGTIQRHEYNPAHPEKLSRPPTDNTLQDHIPFITEDAQGNIWIGATYNGLGKYDRRTERMTRYGSQGNNVEGFTDNSALCSCRSRDSILWIGTLDGNLYKIDPYHTKIPSVVLNRSVSSFARDSLNFWLATDSGLISYNTRTNVYQSYFYDTYRPTSLNSNVVNSVQVDNRQTVWIGTTNGLNRYNRKANNFFRYLHNPKDTNTITSGGIYFLQDDGEFLWLATDNGLDLLEKQSGIFFHFKANSKDSNSISSDMLCTIFRDRSGNIWVGSYAGRGINLFDRSTRTFRHFLGGRSVLSISQDSYGTLWAGTDVGLYKKDGGENDFIQFVASGTGLEQASIWSIHPDNGGHICASTSLGIIKIDVKTGHVNIFNENYGVIPDNLVPTDGYSNSQRDIYFGNKSGYYLVSTDKLTTNTTTPEIVLNGFSVAGKIRPAGGDDLLRNEISLGFDQNTFAIEFAAIHYSNPENNRHLYLLENYDQDWREAGNDRTASYSNLPSGRYTLHLKVASCDDVWAERKIVIIISPPWWRTWWAYCIYGIILVAGGYALHRFQKDRVVKAEKEKTRERELAQAKEIEKAYAQLKNTQAQLIQQEKMASLGELTAGIAHEIQNPLNFVNNFSEVNEELLEELHREMSRKEGEKNEKLENEILSAIKVNEEKIRQHGKRADAIIKNMLLHTRTSSGQKESVDINTLAEEYLNLAYHGIRARDKTFNVKILTDFDGTMPHINMVPQDIGRVILNLINNAFYALSEKAKQNIPGYQPAVTVSTKQLGDKVELRVADNGNGIPERLRSKIFQPFFTTKSAGQGTGLGLSLSYDIIKAHGGEINLQTEEGSGSDFIIQLPVT